jgi:hypothetical protein
MTAILDVLNIAFQSQVSLKDYHDIVMCLRRYDLDGRDVESEEYKELSRLGWPSQYHPCDQVWANVLPQ